MGRFETYGLEAETVRDSFIELAEIIYDHERHSITSHGRDMFSWHPVRSDLFSPPIDLYQAVRPIGAERELYVVKQATFRIFGEDEDVITISRDFEDDMNGDSYAEDVLGRFAASYTLHPHTLCLRAVKEEKKQKFESDRLKAASNQPQFTVTDRRRVS